MSTVASLHISKQPKLENNALDIYVCSKCGKTDFLDRMAWKVHERSHGALTGWPSFDMDLLE